MWVVLLGVLAAGCCGLLERLSTLLVWVGAVVTLAGGAAYLAVGAPVSWFAVPAVLTAVCGLVRLRLVVAGYGPRAVVRTMQDGRRE